jgi:hypothetical protein
VAGQGRGPTCATGAALAEVRRGATRRLGGGGARVEAMRERDKQEKEKADPCTIPAYVHQADTLADDHKRVGLRGAHGALCSSVT